MTPQQLQQLGGFAPPPPLTAQQQVQIQQALQQQMAQMATANRAIPVMPAPDAVEQTCGWLAISFLAVAWVQGFIAIFEHRYLLTQVAAIGFTLITTGVLEYVRRRLERERRRQLVADTMVGQ